MTKPKSNKNIFSNWNFWGFPAFSQSETMCEITMIVNRTINHLSPAVTAPGLRLVHCRSYATDTECVSKARQIADLAGLLLSWSYLVRKAAGREPSNKTTCPDWAGVLKVYCFMCLLHPISLTRFVFSFKTRLRVQIHIHTHTPIHICLILAKWSQPKWPRLTKTPSFPGRLWLVLTRIRVQHRHSMILTWNSGWFAKTKK